jgi:NADPH:quinone reductase-like Zn-dependent oxidoreductase
MKAAIARRYGPADVIEIAELPRPSPRAGEILVEVSASAVTTADWRLRASAFPGGLWIAGRLYAGLFRPRNKVLGADFAGTVVAVGEGAHRFAPGDRVFGAALGRANAEYLTVAEDATVALMPAGLSFTEAAALPFGALCALAFLRDFGRVGPGTRLCVVGATGGVGAYATQIGRALGASVTAVASASGAELARDLGAERVVDYAREDPFPAGAGYDVILDTVRPADFSAVRGALAPGGLYLPLNSGVASMLRAAMGALVPRGPAARRMRTEISGENPADLDEIARMVAEGRLRPVIDSVFPLARVADAHARVETRRRRGAVVLAVRPEAVEARAA